MTKYDTKPLEILQDGIIKDGIAAGNALLWGDGNGVIFERYAGYADPEKGTPVSPDTVFHMYSMTKALTVTAALKLFERGELDLSAPVYGYIPEYKELTVYDNKEIRRTKNVMRLKDLFTMTSALTYLADYDAETVISLKKKLDKITPLTSIAFAKELSSLPLMFEPRTRFQYGLSHDVLGAVMEIITGKTLDLILNEYVFAPLCMRDTYFYQNLPDDYKDRLAKNTAYINGRFKNLPLLPRPVPAVPGINDAVLYSGGSGVVCTARDYAAYLTAMTKKDGGLIKPETYEIMTAPALSEKQRKYYNRPEYDASSFGEEHTFAFGIRVQDKKSKERGGSVGEWGWSGALGTWFFVSPADKLWFLYLHQHTPANHGQYIIKLRKAFYDMIGGTK